MPLYEVAVLELPTKEEEKKGVGEKIVLKPKCIVAPDEQTAALKTVLEDAGELSKVNTNQIKVLVRPF